MNINFQSIQITCIARIVICINDFNISICFFSDLWIHDLIITFRFRFFLFFLFFIFLLFWFFFFLFFIFFIFFLFFLIFFFIICNTCYFFCFVVLIIFTTTG